MECLRHIWTQLDIVGPIRTYLNIFTHIQSEGHEAAQNFDDSGNTALHLVISGAYADAGSALAILKCIPVTVSIPNKDGLLPIEVRNFSL